MRRMRRRRPSDAGTVTDGATAEWLALILATRHAYLTFHLTLYCPHVSLHCLQ